MSSKITKQQAAGLFEIQATVGRTGCYAPRAIVTEDLDPKSIVDIVHAPDTLSTALNRIHRGSMTYEEFQALHGGTYDFEEDSDFDEFDEEEYYVDKDRDTVDRRGKYYDKDKESRLLAAESKNASKGDTGSHKTNRPREVADQSDSRDKGTQQMKGGDENE